MVLTAALSVYNSGVYCNSRMLYGLAEQGDAPRSLMKINARGVPVLAIGVSAVVTLLCVLVNYLPRGALELLMSLVVAALVINWAMISLAHLKFRRAMQPVWYRASRRSGSRSAITCAWPSSAVSP